MSLHAKFYVCKRPALFIYSYVNRAVIVAKAFESTADSVEPWYGTKYKVEQIPEDQIQVNSVMCFMFLPTPQNFSTSL